MFNFTTTKKQNEPNLNTAILGGQNSAGTKAEGGAADANDERGEAYINSRINEIEAQKAELLKKNPDFDMKAELENPAFVSYVWKNGLTVEEAYFLAHRDEIIEVTAKKALGRMMERQNRISENGAGKNSPAVVKKNPKEMSDREIDDVIERVQKGERITF